MAKTSKGLTNLEALEAAVSIHGLLIPLVYATDYIADVFGNIHSDYLEIDTNTVYTVDGESYVKCHVYKTNA